MKISKLQVVGSYLFPIVLKKVKAPGQKTIQLQLRKGQFQLAYGYVFYSDGKAYFPFRKAFRYLGDRMLQQQSILVLGSGIGSIGMILADLYPRSIWHLKYVELHAAILDLCQEVMTHFPTVKAEYVKADAIHFMQQDTGFYDLICVDVFDEHIVPQQILSAAFFQLLKNRLTENGIIVLNAMFQSEHQALGFHAIIDHLFVHSHLIPTKKNAIYILFND